jgi:hypothetical protein
MASQFGHGWAWARLKGDGKALTKMAARISQAPDEIFVKYYYQQVVRIVFQARKLMLKTIDESTTPTGAARARRGGEPGRIDTGKMRKRVWARANKTGAGRYRADVGWLDGIPGYAIFQEHGTRGGIVAMNALQIAGDYIEEEMRKLGRGGYKYRRDTDWDWDAPDSRGNVQDPPAWLER